MKANLHPEYIPCKIHCACGNVVETFSTRKEMHVNSCASCHPFYTGNSKLIDTEGRVDRFNKKYARFKR